MSIVSVPRPGVPIANEASGDPALPPSGEVADPPIDFRLEDEDGVPAGFAPSPPPVNYLPTAPSPRGEDRDSRRGDWESRRR